MGMLSAIERLIGIVESAEPRSLVHVPFRAIDRLDGAAEQLERLPPSEDRIFDVSLTNRGADGGEVGCPPLLRRAEGSVRVRYAIAGSSARRQAIQAEDADTIVRALHTPIDWQTPTTGLHAVAAMAAATTAEVIPSDSDPARHELLSIPFVLYFREAP